MPETNSPFLTVVVLTFNNYEELIETLQSFNDIPAIEIVVVNGGSCEKTKKFLESQKERIVSLSEKDRGISDAFNKGTKLATTPFITYINSGDTLIEKTYFDKAISFFQNHTDVYFVHSSILFDDPKYGKMHIKPKNHRLGFGQPYLHPSMIFRREVFERVGYFDESFKIGMDYDLIVRMRANSLSGAMLDFGPVVLMNGRGVSSMQEKKGISENYRSLVMHGQNTVMDTCGVLYRYTKNGLKNLFRWLGLDLVVKLYKTMKYGKS